MTDQQADPKTTPLLNSREAIDKVDGEIIRLLAERMNAVREIGSFKADNPTAPLRDEGRERELFQAWARMAEKSGVNSYFAGRILREILNYSRRDQERHLSPRQESESGARTVRVGYQGVPACYSDLAITKCFATRDVGRIERMGFRNFGSAFDALERGEVDYALLPIENTIAGSINEVYDNIARRAVTIVGEEVWAVDHCLVARPGATLDGIRLIRSHPVALQQCHQFLDGLVGCVTESYHDTAGAAQSLTNETGLDIAAIASEEAAEHYELTVLRRDISDQRTNLTRFLLIATRPEPVDSRQPTKTSLLFSVGHQHGALLRCLQSLEEQGINLTKLESRPQPNTPWEYLFYADIEGHADQDHVKQALVELRNHTNHCKVLGSYLCRLTEGDARSRVSTQVEPSTNGKAEDGGAASNGKAGKAARSNGKAAVAVKPAGNKKDEGRLYALPAGGTTKPISVGGVEIGGDRFVLISGPCAIESRQQVMQAAELVKRFGAQIMRGGAFKPRTSPYAFQGLGYEGLEMLVEAGHAYEMPVVTEVLRPEDVQKVAQTADMLQVGARNMQNFALLRELGRVDRAVLLKRGMSATVDELLMAAEYIMAGGNNRVVLCERGIRTFETATRATLDVSAVPVLKGRTHLPVIVDPSHAAGVRHLVVPLALSAAAAGADGLIVEAHPNPDEALCDKDQALTENELTKLIDGLRPIVEGLGRTM